VFWTPGGESYMLHAINIFKKKPCAIEEIDIFICFVPVLYEGSMEEV
jgi:hypothetical protein